MTDTQGAYCPSCKGVRWSYTFKRTHATFDAERALREANDYRPFEWTSPAIPPTQ